MIAELGLAQSLEAHVLLAVEIGKGVKALGELVVDNGIGGIDLDRLLEVNVADLVIDVRTETHRDRTVLGIEQQAEHPKLVKVREGVADDRELAGIAALLSDPALGHAENVVEVAFAYFFYRTILVFSPVARDMIALRVILLSTQVSQVVTLIQIVEGIAILPDGDAAAVQFLDDGGVRIVQESDQRCDPPIAGVIEDHLDRLTDIATSHREGISHRLTVDIVALEVAVIGEGDANIVVLAPEVGVGESDITADLSAFTDEGFDPLPVAEDRPSEIKHASPP